MTENIEELFDRINKDDAVLAIQELMHIYESMNSDEKEIIYSRLMFMRETFIKQAYGRACLARELGYAI